VTAPPLLLRVDSVCAEVLEGVGAGPFAARAGEIRAGLREPLRVAIVGRVKAGKSTLLNALLRERIAPTDAGECTRHVCWYRHGQGYAVGAWLEDGTHISLPFRRGDDAIEIELGTASSELRALDVTWPAAALAGLTLIDTPGVGSSNEAIRLRAAAFLHGEDHIAPEADAVVYLMRHLHRTDMELLESLYAEAIASTSPVNAVAVLSRADEIGAARPDAMDASAAIAERYARDPHLRAAVADVLPLAGLLAETGATLRESEMEWLRAFAASGPDVVAMALLSVDRFRRQDFGPLTGEVREILLRRFGLFGLRFAVREIAEGRIQTATDLSRALVQVSGIGRLRGLMDEYFTSRAGHLKARSALLSLRAVARDMERDGAQGARYLLQSIEEIEGSAHELAELRLLHLSLTGAAGFTEEEQSEVRRLVSNAPAHVKLGLDEHEDGRVLLKTALDRVEHWRRRAATPLAGRDSQIACEVATRSYEGIHAGLAGRR